MGIDNFYLRELHKVIQAHPRSTPWRAVCLGYPDLLVDRETIADIMGTDLSLPMDPHADKIKSWHNYAGDVYDGIAMLQHLGCTVTVLDKIPHRGIEVVMDLNDVLPLNLKDTADLIIDTGTLEHCFNVGTAFRNMCEMVSLHGIVVTAAPANKLGHGYYNFCDNVYHDGFTANGFEVISVKLLGADNQEIHPIPPKKRGAPPKSIWVCVARKVQSRPWSWPVQGKYL